MVSLLLVVALVVSVVVFPLAGCKKQQSQVTLRILTVSLPFGQALGSTVAEAYSAYTNGRVKIVTDEYPYDALYEKIMVELAAESDSYDMVTTDCIWAGQVMANDWAYSLEDLKAAHPDWPDLHYENIMSYGLPYVSLNNKNYGITAMLNTQVLAYRKDLFEQYDVKVPTNWTEFLEAAKKLTVDTNGDGKPDVYGTVLLMGGADAGYSDWTFRLFGEGPIQSPNAFIMSDKAEPIFQTDGRGAKALKQVAEVIPYCPPGTLGFDYADAATVFNEGQVAMIMTWNDATVECENPEVSQVAGKVGYAAIPYGKENWQSIGGYQLFMNKATKNTEEVYRFMAWMLDKPDGYRAMYEKGETGLVTKELIADPEVRKQVPYLSVWDQVKNTTPIPVWYPEFTEVQRIIYEEISTSLAGQQSADQAMQDAADRVRKLMSDAGYYSGK